MRVGAADAVLLLLELALGLLGDVGLALVMTVVEGVILGELVSHDLALVILALLMNREVRVTGIFLKFS